MTSPTMGAPEDKITTTEATAEEIAPSEGVIEISREHAERMDGAFFSIVASASLPCALVVMVTSILLGVMYRNKITPYKGWEALYVQPSKSTGDLYQTLNTWKKGGGPAIFVDFNPSSLTAIATITGKCIP
jgi:hypothetical protein